MGAAIIVIVLLFFAASSFVMGDNEVRIKNFESEGWYFLGFVAALAILVVSLCKCLALKGWF